MILNVTLSVDADWCDEDLGPVKTGDPLANRIEDSVAEAIRNILYLGQANGFSHDMEELIAITVSDDVVAKIEKENNHE